MAKIRIFLSWSGGISEHVATQFKQKLTGLLGDEVDPFFSKDIAGGARGIHVIEQALREANHSLLFLTRQNRGREWIPFEAGAVAKNPDKSLVCPILIGFPHEELEEPLSLFQTKQITDVSGIVGVFNSIFQAVRGRDGGVKPAERSDLEAWLADLNKEVSCRLSITLEDNPLWARTTIGQVSGDTQSSPFQVKDALRVARSRVVFTGQNLYSLARFWGDIRDFLLGKRKQEHGAAAGDRSVELLFLAPDDDRSARAVAALVDAWSYTVAENPDKFRENLRESVEVWRQRQTEAGNDGFGNQLKIRLATTFIPLSQTFIDPDQPDQNGKLFLRPFYRGPQAGQRPIILLSEKHNETAFGFYWGAHQHLWENAADTRPL
jgi:hypothetical protein